MKQNMHRHSGLAKKSHTESTELKRKRLHKDWRVWLAVILMLAAIIIYVLSLDDSLLAFGIGPSL
jgi:Mg2+/citrate symporter